MKKIKIFQDFKEFAIKGNMFDLAIGIIIGTAFNKIVSSLVSDIIMPALGFAVGKVNLSHLSYPLQQRVYSPNGEVRVEEVVIKYGQFLDLLVNFVLITFSIFLVVRFFNHLKRKGEDEKDTSVPTPKDIALLAEIRDLLKSNKVVDSDPSGDTAKGS
jgi:large conductance mechanosensitive channel